MKEEHFIKAAIAAAAASLTAYFSVVLIPLCMLALVMAADYVSGLMKAWHTGTLSSGIGLRGIVKKLGYLLAVIVGGTVDWLIAVALRQVGITLDSRFLFGLMVIIWFMINELISILENIQEIGVEVPGFLASATKRLKSSLDKKTESEENKHE